MSTKNGCARRLLLIGGLIVSWYIFGLSARANLVAVPHSRSFSTRGLSVDLPVFRIPTVDGITSVYSSVRVHKSRGIRA